MADQDFVLKARTLLGKPENLKQFINSINGAIQTGIKKDFNINVNARTLRPAITSTKDLTRQTNNLKYSTVAATSAFEKLGRQAAISIRRFGAFALVVSGFYKLSGAISSTVGEALEFQDTMVKIGQVTGLAVKDLRELEKEASRLSTTLGVNSKELINSTEVLAQAGYTAEQTRKAMALLAKVQLSGTFSKDISENAEGLIAIQAQFGVAIDDLQSKFDAAGKVAKAFAIESEDVIAAVKRTGGAFAASGGSFEEFISLLTAVRSTTRESAESIATGFRTIFTRLQRPRTIDFFKTLGISLQDLDGQFIGGYQAIAKISAALKDIAPTDPIFAKVTEELGGYRQISKSIPLIQQFAKAEEARRIAMFSAGEIEKDAIRRQESLLNSFTKLREELALLVRNFINDQWVRNLIDVFIKGSTAAIQFADSLRAILPLATALSGIALFKAAGPFGKGLKSELFSSSAIKRNKGGTVPGIGNTDSVPAMLTPGEFVLRKSAVQRIGIDNLKRANYNKGGLVGYADGGLVSGSSGIRAGLSIASLAVFMTNIKDTSDEMKTLSQTIGSVGVYLAVFSSLLGKANEAQKYSISKNLSSFGKTDQSKIKEAFGLLEEYAGSSKGNKKLVDLLGKVKLSKLDENLYGSARGMYQSGKIKINTKGTPEEIAAILIHELTHFQQELLGISQDIVDPIKDPKKYLSSDSEKGARANEKRFNDFLKKKGKKAFSYSEDDLAKIYANRIEGRIRGSERFSALSNLVQSDAKNYQNNLLSREEKTVYDQVGYLRSKEYELSKLSEKQFVDPDVSEKDYEDTQKKLSKITALRIQGEERLLAISAERSLIAMGLTKVESQAINSFVDASNELDKVRSKISNFQFKNWTTTGSSGTFHHNNQKELEDLLEKENELESIIANNAPIVSMVKALGPRSTEVGKIRFGEIGGIGNVTNPPSREMTDDELADQWVRRQLYKKGLDEEENYKSVRPKQLDVLSRNEEYNRLKENEKLDRIRRARERDGFDPEKEMNRNWERAMYAKSREDREKSNFEEDWRSKDRAEYAKNRALSEWQNSPNMILSAEDAALQYINESNVPPDHPVNFYTGMESEHRTMTNEGKRKLARDRRKRSYTPLDNFMRRTRYNLYRAGRATGEFFSEDGGYSRLNNKISSSSVGRFAGRMGIPALAAGGATSGLLSNMGSHRLSKGESSGVGLSAAGGALSGAINAGGLGFAIAGPIGAAVGTVAGGLYGLVTSFNSAKKEFESFKFNEAITPIKEGLAQFAAGLATPISQLPNISDGLSEFEKRINNSSGDDLTTAQGEFANIAPQIDALFTSLAQSSTSFEVFEKSIGGSLRSFSRLRNINYDTMVKGYKDTIEANKKSNIELRKYNQVLEQMSRQALTLQAFSDSVKKTSEDVTKFGDIASSILNGSIADRSSIFDRLSGDSIAESRNLDRFTGSDFSTELGNAFSIDKMLPALLYQIREGGVQNIDDVLKDSLPTGNARDNLINAVREMIGPTGEDNKFIDSLQNNFIGTLDQLRSKLTPLLDIYKNLSTSINSATQTFAQSLEEIARREEDIANRRSKIIDIRGQQERFQAGTQNRDVNFSLLRNLENIQLKNITGFNNNSPQFLGAALERAIQKRDELSSQIGQSGPENRAELIKELDQQKNTINRVTKALEYMGNATERVALLEEQRSQIQKRRENKTNFFDEYLLSSPEEKSKMSRTIVNASSVNGRSFNKLSQDQKKEVWDLYNQFSDERLFNGKTGREKQTQIRSESFDLAPGNTSKEVRDMISGKPGKEEISLQNQINRQFETSAIALDTLNTTQTNNLATINATLTDGFANTIAAIRENYQQQLEDDHNRRIAESDAKIQAISNDLNKFQKLSKYGITDQHSFDVAKAQLTANKELPNLLKEEQTIGDKAAKVRKLIEGSNGKLGDVKDQILNELAGYDPEQISKISKELVNSRTEYTQGGIAYQTSANVDGVNNLVNKLFSSETKKIAAKLFTHSEDIRKSNLNNKMTEGLYYKYDQFKKDVDGISNTDISKSEKELREEQARKKALLDEQKEREEWRKKQKSLGFNSGGGVPGIGNTDTVPAMLTPGEFVLRKEAAKSIGYDELHRMNAVGYASGGVVGESKKETILRRRKEKTEERLRKRREIVEAKKKRRTEIQNRLKSGTFSQEEFKSKDKFRDRDAMAAKRAAYYENKGKSNKPQLDTFVSPAMINDLREERLKTGEAAAEKRVRDDLDNFRHQRMIEKQYEMRENRYIEQKNNFVNYIKSFKNNINKPKAANIEKEYPRADMWTHIPSKPFDPRDEIMPKSKPVVARPKRKVGNKTTTGFNSGGAVSGTSGPAMDNNFYQAIKDFSKVADKISDSLKNFPSEISHSINGRIEVIINGADVLTKIMPEVQDLVEEKVKTGIRNFTRNNFPELG